MDTSSTGSEDAFIRPEFAAQEDAKDGALPPNREGALRHFRRRRILLPIFLFLLTCLSTFWAGSAGELAPLLVLQPPLVFPIVQLRWPEGLAYMALVMGILLAHEMGHYLQTLRYRIPATLPLFLPMPISLVGTMGAVIAMRTVGADRKQLFDIGISGPWAGLLVAVPIICFGVVRAEPFPMHQGATIHFPDPLLVQGLIRWLRPDLMPGQELTMNPMLMAGWVAMLVTGLNMLPISQLDGGHVAYALFGRFAHWLARGIALTALIMIVGFQHFSFIPMFLLVLLMGIRHPPTANDRVPLGRLRRLIGIASLAIPVLCLAPLPEFDWQPPKPKPANVAQESEWRGRMIPPRHSKTLACRQRVLTK